MVNHNQEWINFVRSYSKETGKPWSLSMKEARPYYLDYKIENLIPNKINKDNKRVGKINQVGGALTGEQIQKLIGYGIKLVGENKFFGLDAKTVSNLVTLIFKTGKNATNLTEILNIIKQNPYAAQISQIPFTSGPQGVKDTMQSVIAAIDADPNSVNIYTSVCAVYKVVLIKGASLFIKVIGSLLPGAQKYRIDNQNRIVRAIQSLNYNDLSNEYNALPHLIRQLLEDPTALQTVVTQVMSLLVKSNSSLGFFIQNNLFPVVNSSIDIVRKILPIMFSAVILLQRCNNLSLQDINELNKLIEVDPLSSDTSLPNITSITPSITNVPVILSQADKNIPSITNAPNIPSNLLNIPSITNAPNIPSNLLNIPVNFMSNAFKPSMPLLTQGQSQELIIPGKKDKDILQILKEQQDKITQLEGTIRLLLNK